MSAEKSTGKLGFLATWSMAVGGMVGGGIYTVLGVVIEIAGHWMWLSFIIAGLIAWASAFSYARLSAKFGEGGGAFIFLREINRDGFAGSLSWVLIVGYVLTISVYAFTFGHYFGNAVGLGAVMSRIAALVIIGALILVNLRGVGQAAGVEIATVWGGIIILVGLAVIGLSYWQPAQLGQGIESHGIVSALIGGASVFMAYEGFQLLSYDYSEIENPDKNLFRGLMLAVPAVIGIYLAVALGATMLVGAGTMIEQKDIALAIAGQTAAGTVGLWLITLAAAFSTGSAINSTLFATARLADEVAEDGELPELIEHTNSNGIPDRAVIGLGAVSAILASFGSLATLVEAASLAFLFTFTIVNGLAFRQLDENRWLPALGAAGAGIAAITLTLRLIRNAPVALAFLAVLIAFAIFGRPIILRHTRTANVEG